MLLFSIYYSLLVLLFSINYSLLVLLFSTGDAAIVVDCLSVNNSNHRVKEANYRLFYSSLIVKS